MRRSIALPIFMFTIFPYVAIGALRGDWGMSTIIFAGQLAFIWVACTVLLTLFGERIGTPMWSGRFCLYLVLCSLAPGVVWGTLELMFSGFPFMGFFMATVGFVAALASIGAARFIFVDHLGEN